MLLGKCKLEPISLRYSKEERWYTIECIDLTGVIYPHHQSHSLEQLKNMRNTQEPHVLVDNSGNVLGNFVITNVEEKQTSFFPNGLPRKVEFQLKLKNYNK